MGQKRKIRVLYSQAHKINTNRPGGFTAYFAILRKIKKIQQGK